MPVHHRHGAVGDEQAYLVGVRTELGHGFRAVRRGHYASSGQRRPRIAADYENEYDGCRTARHGG